jgi:hypothetical protein
MVTPDWCFLVAAERAGALREFMLGHKVNLTPFLRTRPRSWLLPPDY